MKNKMNWFLILIVTMATSLFSTSSFAAGFLPTCHPSDNTACDTKYGTFLSPNYQYKFVPSCGAGAWTKGTGSTVSTSGCGDPGATFSYALDGMGAKIANPTGTSSIRLLDGKYTLYCNENPLTEVGVLCYDASKVSFDSPAHKQCLIDAHCA